MDEGEDDHCKFYPAMLVLALAVYGYMLRTAGSAGPQAAMVASRCS
jgi:hypothetical protein